MKTEKQLLDSAIEKIQNSFYKMATFWVCSKGIDGATYGSYKQIGMSFINNRKYVCMESDYAPAFLMLDVIHIPGSLNWELYKELKINNRYSNVMLTPENIEIIEKYGYLVK